MQKINKGIRTNMFFGVINLNVSGREHQRIYLPLFVDFSEICPCIDSLFPECAVLFQKAVCIENSIVSPHQNEINAKQAEEQKQNTAGKGIPVCPVICPDRQAQNAESQKHCEKYCASDAKGFRNHHAFLIFMCLLFFGNPAVVSFVPPV